MSRRVRSPVPDHRGSRESTSPCRCSRHRPPHDLTEWLSRAAGSRHIRAGLNFTEDVINLSRYRSPTSRIEVFAAFCYRRRMTRCSKNYVSGNALSSVVARAAMKFAGVRYWSSTMGSGRANARRGAGPVCARQERPVGIASREVFSRQVHMRLWSVRRGVPDRITVRPALGII